MREKLYRGRLRVARTLKSITRRPFSRVLSPFESPGERCLLIHRCYHKVGTVWFGRVLQDVAAEFGMTFGSCKTGKDIRAYENEHGSDVFLDFGSHIRLSELPKYRGSHLYRDPRDLVVSGYFYHLWTDESWAHQPQPKYDGLTYQAYLKKQSKEDGILLEMTTNAGWIRKMGTWTFSDPCILDIRYEDMIADEEGYFRRIFNHYGFSAKAVDISCAIARKYSLAALKRRGGVGSGSHIRSGKPSQWREHFSPAHVEAFKSRFPNVLQSLGYEKDNSWGV